MQGGYLSRLANEELTWETSEQLDLGFDARFLGGKLNLNFDYYIKKTRRMNSVKKSTYHGKSQIIPLSETIAAVLIQMDNPHNDNTDK